MKICFLGNFRPPHSTENDYLWTLRERLGVDVVALQETEASGDEIEASALESDAFLWMHTHGWSTPGRSMTAVLEGLKSKGVPSFAYHLDLYMPIRRWREYIHHDYMKLAHFFTVDKLMADWLNANTQTRGHFIRAGVVERDCRYDPRHRKTHDVIFVGSYRYHPEWRYRPRLIDWLKRTYGPRFEHWGPHGLGLVRGKALNDLYASTKVVVGDSLCPGFKYPYYTSDRVYEVLGRGGFLVHPRIEGMQEELTEAHLAYYEFNDFHGLKKTIDHYLEAAEEREAIRLAGHQHVRANCTYTDRWRQVLDILEAS